MTTSQRVVLPALAAVAALLLPALACSFSTDLGDTACQHQTVEYLGDIRPLLDEWHDTVPVASATSRIALSPVVQDMQRIKRAIEEVQPPSCAVQASSLLMIGIDDVTDSFVEFMAEQGDAVVGRGLTVGLAEMTTATDQLSALAGEAQPAAMPSGSDDGSYAACAQATLGQAQPLYDEVNASFSQSALSKDYVPFCAHVDQWKRTADGLRTEHEQCPRPLNAHLQAARIWLGIGYAQYMVSLDVLSDWCQQDPQTLTASDCFRQVLCSSALHDQNAFVLCITRAEEELRGFGGE